MPGLFVNVFTAMVTISVLVDLIGRIDIFKTLPEQKYIHTSAVAGLGQFGNGFGSLVWA
jgi:hypothetical protein